MQTTVAAISTAQGEGGIGIVRISGPKALEVADKVFKAKSGKPLSALGSWRACYGRVADCGEEIDEAVALVFRAPRSYTGEDVVEISCHGGLYLTRRVLRAVLSHGAAPAGPGEFTRRAYLNGRIGLTEAEAVMDLIGAQGRQAARAALAGHGGALHRAVEEIRGRLVGAAAHLAAWADYPEEEIPAVSPEALRGTLMQARDALLALLNRYDAGRAVLGGVETAIVGSPNVGKSTLMNLLAGCERSIVTALPGTTRDVVEETVLLGEIPLRLADTAGIRDTEDPVERIGVERARARIGSAGLVLALFDASRPLEEGDRRLLDSLQEVPAVAVVNKTDLPKKINEEEILNKVKHLVYISARTGEGLPALTRAVEEAVGAAELDPSAALLANERQREAAKRALSGVEEALRALSCGMTLDAVTVEIEEAAGALLELTGERVQQAVVDEVFRSFCVGK
jgi:tRNA modification GTPase